LEIFFENPVPPFRICKFLAFKEGIAWNEEIQKEINKQRRKRAYGKSLKIIKKDEKNVHFTNFIIIISTFTKNIFFFIIFFFQKRKNERENEREKN
jgi:hypothetical protein